MATSTGSIHEFHSLITPLTQLSNITVNGTKAAYAYNVIVPSLPGFAASSPAPANWTIDDTARIFQTLMTDILGYHKFVAHGTDWVSSCLHTCEPKHPTFMQGSAVAYSLYANFPSSVRVLHLNFLPFYPPTPQEVADANITLNDFGKFATERAADWNTTGSGYFAEQATKVSTKESLSTRLRGAHNVTQAEHDRIRLAGQSGWSTCLDRGEVQSLSVLPAI